MGFFKGLIANTVKVSLGLSLVQPVISAYATDLPQPDNWPTISSQTSSQPLTLAPGIIYQNQKFVTSAGPLQFSTVNVDLTSPTVGLQTVVGQEKILSYSGETVSSMANRTNAVAGINGDYFDINNTEAPIDIVESNGQLNESPIESTNSYYASLALDNSNHASIVRFSWQGQVIVPANQTNLDVWNKDGEAVAKPSDQTQAISAFNAPIKSSGLFLYDEKAGYDIPTPPSGIHRVSVLLQQVPNSDLYEVKSITENSDIPVVTSGQYELVGQGTEADWLLNNVLIGEQIEPTLNTSPDWHNYKTIIAGGPVLVQNGQVQTQNLTGDQNLYPLTAVGLSADGTTMSMVVVDGRQNNISSGLSRLQFAEYFKSLGLADVLDLDGGGSSELVARKPGDTTVTVMNSPSDGVERNVANGLFVYNLAKTGSLDQLVVDVPKTKVFVGSQLKFTVKGVDANLQPVPVDTSSLVYSTTVPGTQVANGVFTAGNQAGTGVIRVSEGNVTKEVQVQVVDKLGSLTVSPNPAVVTPGISLPFTTVATDVNNDPVSFDNSQGQWTVQGDIGTVDKNGVLQASNQAGDGQVTLNAGGVSIVINVNVGKPPIMLDDFESADAMSHWSSSAVRAAASISLSSAPNPVRHGQHSLALSYDFTNQSGTSAAYALADSSRGGRLIDGHPISLGMWVYGDGGNHWLRGVVVDGIGTKHPVDFTGDQQLNWTGWKYVSVPIPDNFVAPMKLTQIYVVEPHPNKNKGTVYFDDIRAVYYDMGEDLTGPTFSQTTPALGETIYTSKPKISTVLTDDKSGVDASSIVMTVDGQPVQPNYDPDFGHLSYTPTYPLADGVHHVTIDAVDKAGNPALPKADWTFTIYTGPDQWAPVLTDRMPTDGTISKVSTPRISIRAEDAYSGVDPASIQMQVDGQMVQIAYDLQSGTIYYMPTTALSDGTHTVNFTVKDKSGNVAAKTWTFTVLNQLPTPKGDTFEFSIIGDGGYFNKVAGDLYSNKVFEEVVHRVNQEPSDFVITMGDEVENDNMDNIGLAKQAVSQINKPFFSVIGNHEISGSNDRTDFEQNFGPTAYAFHYSSADFIVFDTASEGIDEFDSSQWEWLQDELNRSTASNVFLFDHVPTIDPYNTGHGMASAEEQRFTSMVEKFKDQHPDKTVTVVAAHLHAYNDREANGVHYLIIGNSGGTEHIQPSQGGFYHYANFHVSPQGVTWDVVPLLSQVTLEAPTQPVHVGDSLNLSAQGTFFTGTDTPYSLPIEGSPFSAKWTSSDSSIATIDDNGKLTAKQDGTVTITLQVGGQQVTRTIQVLPTISALLSPSEPDGANLWYVHPVALTLNMTHSSEFTTVYSTNGGGTWNTYTQPVVFNKDGSYTVAYGWKDSSGSVHETKEINFKIDQTPPTITYTGNTGTYTVDQAVYIQSAVTDNLSGVESCNCTSITGPAYTFSLGVNTFPSTATDVAGNVGTGATSFKVIVTFDSLSNLTQEFVTKPGVSNSMVAKLKSAAGSMQSGDGHAANGQLDAYANEVSAQSGKSLTDEQAKLLISFANVLRKQTS